MRQIQFYRTDSGREPFTEWIEALDLVTAGRILGCIKRIAMGGGKLNVKPVGKGVYEVKMHFGPGYRAYFGLSGPTILLLLLDGDKSNQFRDIRQAQEYWRLYAQE